MAQTVRLIGPDQRALAQRLIAAAPDRTVVTLAEERRTLDQNAKLHAMLSDIARARPDGRCHTPEVWKALAMHACGHAVQFINGLDGQPFPTGFRSSRLTKIQMSELIEFLYEYGSRYNVMWSEEPRE
jgi:hypothetical protein